MRPRIRTIKPEIWQDERVGKLTRDARLLFVGLITMADDQGRLRELPAAIRGHVFPYDCVGDSKISRWVQEISAAGLVVRYEVSGANYVAFRRWSKHQKVDRARDSSLPPPPGFDELSTNDRRSLDDDSRPPRRRAFPDPDPCSSDTSQGETDDARVLFDYWRTTCGHPSSKPTRDRLAKIRARRAEGYSSDEIRKAIDGAARGAFVDERGKRFDDIELICRNGSKLESFVARADAPAKVTPIRSFGREHLMTPRRIDGEPA